MSKEPTALWLIKAASELVALLKCLNLAALMVLMVQWYTRERAGNKN